MKPRKPVDILLGVLLLALTVLIIPTGAAFEETLTVLPLAHHGHVALLFNFTLDWDADTSGTLLSNYRAYLLFRTDTGKK